jgi:tetratricopeptide (TPR) repeat protein
MPRTNRSGPLWTGSALDIAKLILKHTGDVMLSSSSVSSLAASLLAVLLLALTPAAATAQPVDSLLARGTSLLEQGTTHSDAATLQQARSFFQRATASDTLTAFSHYYLALADYRLINVSGEDQREQYMDDAATHLETSLELRDGWAEANALLALVYGRKAGQGMLSGMRYGPKASSRLDAAKEAAPGNPRVLLADGISLINKPRMWGGDKDLGLKRLQQAVRQFEERSTNVETASNSLEPSWGHAEAYAWIGIMHAKANRHDQVRAAFQSALSVRPQYAWVENILMPKLAAAE